jgi:hypothetical protein
MVMNDDLRKIQTEASKDMFKVLQKNKKNSEDQVSVLRLKYRIIYETAAPPKVSLL